MDTTFYKYFKGLDGLRFIAATAVLAHHVELIKADLGFLNFSGPRFFTDLGPIGVTFFFVLSGFLITYLLLKEKRTTASLSLRNFYFRRAFRILPLYYLITFLSFFILPLFGFFDQPFFSDRLSQEFHYKLFLYLILLPQIVFIQFPNAPIPYGVVAWSIGVEEQFYLLWPIIIKWLKGYWFMFFFIFVLFSILPIFLQFLSTLFPTSIGNDMYINFFKKYLETLRFSCMALGGALALALIENRKTILDILYNRYLQLACFCLLLVLLKWGYPFTYFKHEIYSVIFGVIILNAATNNENGINKMLSYILDSKFFTLMGVRSYGIYMYHMIGIQIAVKLYMALFGAADMSILTNIIFYSFCLLFTFIISVASYKWFEVPILNVRRSFLTRAQ